MYSSPQITITREQEYHNNKHQTVSSVGIVGSILLLIVMLIWMISGGIAFIMSIVCFFYDSSLNEKVIGLLLALLVGPFYWLYYVYNSAYCNKN
jgi:hypothetical protein